MTLCIYTYICTYIFRLNEQISSEYRSKYLLLSTIKYLCIRYHDIYIFTINMIIILRCHYKIFAINHIALRMGLNWHNGVITQNVYPPPPFLFADCYRKIRR